MARQKHKKHKTKKPKQNEDEAEEVKNAPHSIVIFRGRVGNYIEELMRDFRRVMEPNTATRLKISDRTTIKDYVSVSGMLHVTHLVMFSRSEISPYMRLCRLPHGPTLTFKIQQYSLARDIVAVQKRQQTYDKQFKTSPLVILNNFGGEALQFKLLTSMFQNMFPSINITTVKLSTIRRCVLVHYDSEDGTIEFRHYSIKVVPVGVSKAVKRLVQAKIPDLSKLNDISDFIAKAGNLSDSEAEDDPVTQVTLPQTLASRGNQAGNKSAVRLVELGPRLKMQLLKIEEGLLDGEVLYHQYIKKTEEERKLIRHRREQRKHEKEKAQKIQEANRLRKEKEKEELKQKTLEGAKRKQLLLKKKNGEDEEESAEDDDDADYYRKEVGQEPEKDLFDVSQKPGKSKRVSFAGGPAAKRMKRDAQKKFTDKDDSGRPNKEVSFRKGGTNKGGRSNRDGDREGSFRRGGAKGGRANRDGDREGSFRKGGAKGGRTNREGSFRKGGAKGGGAKFKTGSKGRNKGRK